MEGLKTCPFCGGSARISYGKDFGDLYAFAMCNICGMRSRRQYFVAELKESMDAAETRAAALWNRRTNCEN